MPYGGDRLADYVDVAERIQQFYAKFPDGRLTSEIVTWQIDGRAKVGNTDVLLGYVVIKAYAYRTPDDEVPGTGHSSLIMPGGTPFTRNSEIENAETSAWGRAIASCGVETRRGLATSDEIRSKEHDGIPYSSYEVNITPSAEIQPERGGHQPDATRIQVESILDLNRSLNYSPADLADVVCGILELPALDLPEEIEEQQRQVKRFLASLSAPEAGKVIQVLSETVEADRLNEEEEAAPGQEALPLGSSSE